MLAVSRAPDRRFTIRAPSFHLRSQLATRLVVSGLYSRQKLPPLTSLISSSSVPVRGLCAAVPPVRRRPECVSNSAASFGTAGGGSGGEGAGGGWSTDVIILDVGGMTCEGCAASVKRILESQVSSPCSDS
uniref:Copper-transporting ATPase PAA1ic-like isoform X1 n=1 Tax=Rhizophora mucronata TaxID=61149 RepID=A0A2P2JJ25_RHIMU